jgi:hypothetical protein
MGGRRYCGGGRRVNVHRLLEQPVEEQAAVLRGAAVEAEGELVEVVVELLRPDGALMRAESQRLSNEATR